MLNADSYRLQALRTRHGRYDEREGDDGVSHGSSPIGPIHERAKSRRIGSGRGADRRSALPAGLADFPRILSETVMHAAGRIACSLALLLPASLPAQGRNTDAAALQRLLAAEDARGTGTDGVAPLIEALASRDTLLRR